MGEAGNGAGDPVVDALDEVLVRDAQRGPRDPAPNGNRYDFNRDGLVGAVDRIIARRHRSGGVPALELFTAPAAAAGPATAAESMETAAAQSRGNGEIGRRGEAETRRQGERETGRQGEGETRSRWIRHLRYSARAPQRATLDAHRPARAADALFSMLGEGEQHRWRRRR